MSVVFVVGLRQLTECGGLRRELIRPKDENEDEDGEDEEEDGEDEEEDDGDFIPRGPQNHPTGSPNRPVRPTGNQAR